MNLNLSEEKDQSRYPLPATSPRDLLYHLTKMTTSLERAWSGGLETDSAQNARAEVKEVWHSFVAAFNAWTEHSSELRKRAGLNDIVIEEFPLQDTGLSRLDFEPSTLERRYYQLQIAAIYAYRDLLESLRFIEEPSGGEIRLPDNSVETWWEAGAFSLIRGRARSLTRILEQSDRTLHELLQETSVGSAETVADFGRGDCMDLLMSASSHISTGAYDSALPQLLAALRAVLAEVLPTRAGNLPVPLASSLEDIDALSDVSPHVHLLETACELLGKGLFLDPGVSVPLAKELLLRIQEVVIDPPSTGQLAPLDDRLSSQ